MKNKNPIKSSQELRFNLFKLCSKKVNTSNSWLWCEFNPNQLKNAYLKELKREDQKKIATRLSKDLKCGRSTIEKHLTKLKQSENNCKLPLIVIASLCDFLNPKLKKLINHSIISLFFTNRTSNPIKAVHSLSEEFAEFIGAFAADGHFCGISPEYYINISEGHKDSLELLTKKIKKVFNFNSRLTYSQRDHTWRLWIKNKVICLYFETILGLKPGKKAATVHMPEVIKNSSFNIQKAFMRGVFTFDGGVKTTGSIGLSTRSKFLMEDIKRFLQKERIQHKITYNKNKDAWTLESSSGRNKYLLNKWKDYFFQNTSKYKKIQFFLRELEISNLKQLEELFPLHHHSRITLNDIYLIIKEINKGEIEDIMEEIKKRKLPVATTTLYKYLYILTKSEMINKEKELIKTNKNAFPRVAYSLGDKQTLKCQL
ncbi:MAG: LAGLIDADG family homing endonuclease [Candidatus Woesearchaeota archaeon]